ncbi:glycosyltransferase-like domain-containing protein 1 [Trichonephila clavata]|uniref:tRNA-queuosine alpha-mannosyltransferase n=1 Tax=Trichonephila clavata TaxID=2740835 RepID=A0A8X6H5C9_TRICU|nr:glycosyltransferase-like domain-containing protein 1 [Trichonephila clavata]
MPSKQILLLEGFYGGSHKQLIDLICELFPTLIELHTMTPKKWHWRGLTSPLHFSEAIPINQNFRVLFTSSVVSLAQLIALRSDLAQLYKIVYFHENQLAYPVREQKKRYFQHGYNDILSCLVADKILFNSNYNKESFLKSLPAFFNVMPDYRPKNLDQKIRSKCEVVYFPIEIQEDCLQISENDAVLERPLHIVWSHRWEHDKDPNTFFSVMYRLKDSGESFNLSVIGETFTEKPKIFEEARKYLEDHIVKWGYIPEKEEYYKVLRSADVVVSTAIHEFFGVSMMEATSFHCYPLCPNKLVYPEIYPKKYLYNTPNQLYKKLKYFCKHPNAARRNIEVDLAPFTWETLKSKYKSIFMEAMT